MINKLYDHMNRLYWWSVTLETYSWSAQVNSGRVSGYRDWDFAHFSSVSPGECLHSTFKHDMTVSFQILIDSFMFIYPSQSAIYNLCSWTVCLNNLRINIHLAVHDSDHFTGTIKWCCKLYLMYTTFRKSHCFILFFPGVYRVRIRNLKYKVYLRSLWSVATS
jgi:hypothetical protein